MMMYAMIYIDMKYATHIASKQNSGLYFAFLCFELNVPTLLLCIISPLYTGIYIHKNNMTLCIVDLCYVGLRT